MTLPSFPLTVTEPGRADAVLAAALDGLTRSAAQRWLEEGRITQNGKPLKKNAKLKKITINTIRIVPTARAPIRRVAPRVLVNTTKLVAAGMI